MPSFDHLLAHLNIDARESSLIFVAVALFAGVLYLYRVYHLESAKLSRMEGCRQQERTGRIKAERQLKQAKAKIQLLETETTTSSSSSSSSSTASSSSSVARLPAGILMRPIGIVESVWPRRNGTPRQACLVPSSRANITFHPWVHPTQSLDSLCEFSHVWVIFLFHFNTNLHKDNVRPLIRPPRLGRKKVGMYATRTPHRPNNLGMSLCRLLSVEKGVVKLAGIDLVSGTPVVDIKPYVRDYDSVVDSDVDGAQPRNVGYQVPGWLSESLHRRQVTFSSEAEAVLVNNWVIKRSGKPGFPPKSFYTSAADVRQFVVETLSYDIRGIRQKEAEVPTYKVFLDVLEIVWSTNEDETTIHIESLSIVDPAEIPYPVDEDAEE